MPKLTLTDLASLANQTSAINTLNNNNTAVETALENTLSRDGTSPNAMGADFDMNGYQILNLPEAVDATDPIRLGDLGDQVGELVDDYISTNPDLEGPPGADGRSFIFRGTYSGATAYIVDDVVTNQSSSWIAIQNTTGNAPPTLPTTSNTWWQALAIKGTDGVGTGDVSAASNFSNDNRLIRSDGTTKGVQASGITVDDSNNVSGVGTIGSGAITSSGLITGTTFDVSNTDTTLSRSAAGRLAVEGKDALLKGQTDDLSTAGYTSTSVSQGTQSTGTLTPAYASGSIQHYTNNGAHTLAPPSGHGTMILDVTNGASAGAVTVSGWTKVVGAMTTTNALKYRLFISTGNGGSLLTIQALQ